MVLHPIVDVIFVCTNFLFQFAEFQAFFNVRAFQIFERKALSSVSDNGKIFE